MNQRAGDQPCRLALVATSVADVRDKLVQAIERLEKPKTHRIKDVRHLLLRRSVPPGGQAGFYSRAKGPSIPTCWPTCVCISRKCAPHSTGSTTSSPGTRAAMSPATSSSPPGQTGHSDIAQQLWEIDGAVEAVLTGNAAIHALLRKLGIQPDAMVGHSTGEYSALLASGMIPVGEDEFVGHHLRNLNQMYEEVAQDTKALRVHAGWWRGSGQSRPAG